MPPNLSAQIVCPTVWDFDEKRLNWASVVRALQPRQGRFLFFLALHDKVGSVKAPPIIVDLLSKVFPLPHIKAKSNLSIFLYMPTYVHQSFRHQVI